MLLPEPGRPISATTMGRPSPASFRSPPAASMLVPFAELSDCIDPHRKPCAPVMMTHFSASPMRMRPLYVKRYLITGLFTIVPLWLTWLVFKFIFTLLSHVGAPVVAALFVAISAVFPSAATWLGAEWLQSIIAFIGTIVFLYIVGFATNRVFGQRLLFGFENLIS